jgi:hypothetical protein
VISYAIRYKWNVSYFQDELEPNGSIRLRKFKSSKVAVIYLNFFFFLIRSDKSI